MRMHCGVLLALCCVLPVSRAFVVPQTQTAKTLRAAGVELHSFSDRFGSNRAYEYEGDRVRMGHPGEAVPSWNSAPMELYSDRRRRGGSMGMFGQGYQADNFFPAEGMRGTIVQGGNRQTFSQYGGYNEPPQKEVVLQTNGRPLEANLEVWDGPNNIPESVRVWSQDGARYPFTSMASNRPGSTTSVRNVGPQAFPLEAGVRAGALASTARNFEMGIGANDLYDNYGMGTGTMSDQARLGFTSSSYNNFGRAAASAFPAGRTVQGDGALETFTIEPNVGSVLITAHSEGTPIKAIVELWQGPGTARQIAEVYSQDGLNRPFSAVLETPGDGCTIAIRNVGDMAFPMRASVEPYREKQGHYQNDFPYRESSYGSGFRNDFRNDYRGSMGSLNNNGMEYRGFGSDFRAESSVFNNNGMQYANYYNNNAMEYRGYGPEYGRSGFRNGDLNDYRYGPYSNNYNRYGGYGSHYGRFGPFESNRNANLGYGSGYGRTMRPLVNDGMQYRGYGSGYGTQNRGYGSDYGRSGNYYNSHAYHGYGGSGYGRSSVFSNSGIQFRGYGSDGPYNNPYNNAYRGYDGSDIRMGSSAFSDSGMQYRGYGSEYGRSGSYNNNQYRGSGRTGYFNDSSGMQYRGFGSDYGRAGHSAFNDSGIQHRGFGSDFVANGNRRGIRGPFDIDFSGNRVGPLKSKRNFELKSDIKIGPYRQATVWK